MQRSPIRTLFTLLAIALVGASSTQCHCGNDGGAAFTDAADGDGGGADADSDAAIDASSCDGGASDPNNCGACGNVCAPGQQCAGGVCACPPYQKLCNGQCIPTSVDPDNCGACGNVCTASQACSAGVCVDAAQGCVPPPSGGNPGLIVCNQACVDPLNDSNNCGTCGTPCAAGTGCSGGQCVPIVPVGTGPANCSSSPPVVVGTGPQDCLGNVAVNTFKWALCSCTDITLSAALLTDGYDSFQGPYPPSPKQAGGGVALNGSYTGPQATAVDVGGSMWSSGAGGIATRSPTTVRQELHLAGPLSASVDPLSILDDTFAGGSVSTTSSIGIAKTLYLAPGATVTGNVTRQATVSQAISVPPPCACDPSQLVPIAQIIASQATNNDNTSINLSPTALATPQTGGGVRLDLPCGRYYLTEINKPGTNVTIYARGRTAVFIDGDVVGQIVAFVLDPAAELDVFVKGTITTGGELVVGSPNYPALSRTYIGGSAPLILSGEAGRLGGNIYAANAPVSVTSHLSLYGGLYAQSFTNQETAEIHFDRGVLQVGADCPPPPMGCTSCSDCNNQACVSGTCGSCTSDAQCCAPLFCATDGTCQAIIY